MGVSKLRLLIALLLTIAVLVIYFTGDNMVQPARTELVTEAIRGKRQRFIFLSVRV